MDTSLLLLDAQSYQLVLYINRSDTFRTFADAYSNQTIVSCSQ